MAQTEIRPQKGASLTYRVKWRTGGGRNGRWDWENFDDSKEAERFAKLIDAHRNTRPSDRSSGPSVRCAGGMVAVGFKRGFTQ
ncbi:hypothetical protein [Dactylosporangium sp. CA-233914]|uniref:hypothetical protein n=1 Tax=Dactylosporangium sp. CA-233914 TaxID=3239934 RepID=UPI003D93206F